MSSQMVGSARITASAVQPDSNPGQQLLSSRSLHPVKLLHGRWQRLPLARIRLIPVLRTMDWGPLKAYIDESIHQVPFYAHVAVSIERVDIGDIQPLSHVVIRSRYRKASEVTKSMYSGGVDLFEPCLLRVRGESTYQLMLPPLVEKTDTGYVVLDGVHRIKSALDGDRLPAHIIVLVIKSSAEPLPPLPAAPAHWKDVHVLGSRSRSRKFKQYKREYFRPAGALLRSKRFCFNSVGAFTAACADALAKS
jgi:hypothetical protein